jgi:hypothetical protein
LVRLATSVKIVTDCEQLTIKLKRGCEAILEGYEQSLRTGGRPIVLAEQEKYLQRLGIDAIKPSKDFWETLNRLPGVSGRLPRNLKAALEKTFPPRVDHKLVRRKAGMGSLGQPRFVAIVDWEGGCIAREAKASVPSSSMWVAGRTGGGQGYYHGATGADHQPGVFSAATELPLHRRSCICVCGTTSEWPSRADNYSPKPNSAISRSSGRASSLSFVCHCPIRCAPFLC